MIFTQYTEILRQFKGNLKNFPTDEQAFKMQYALINQKIKTVEHFKKCLFQHLKTSDWFPSHIDLLKHAVRKLPEIKMDKIVRPETLYEKNLREFLANNYQLTVPDVLSSVFRMSSNDDLVGWLKEAGFCYSKFKADYESLKVEENLIFTKEVLAELAEKSVCTFEQIEQK